MLKIKELLKFIKISPKSKTPRDQNEIDKKKKVKKITIISIVSLLGALLLTVGVFSVPFSKTISERNKASAIIEKKTKEILDANNLLQPLENEISNAQSKYDSALQTYNDNEQSILDYLQQATDASMKSVEWALEEFVLRSEMKSGSLRYKMQKSIEHQNALSKIDYYDNLSDKKSEMADKAKANRESLGNAVSETYRKLDEVRRQNSSDIDALKKQIASLNSDCEKQQEIVKQRNNELSKFPYNVYLSIYNFVSNLFKNV